MKIRVIHSVSRNKNGMTIILFLALLAIMMILVTAEARALIQLRREVKLLEQHQIKRLNNSLTNAVITPAPKPQ